jgi:hypothetical protein
MTQQQREAMTQEAGTSQPAGGPGAPGGTPYPDIAGTSHATAAAAAFFRSFFTAKTSKDIEAAHAHFHPGKTVSCPTRFSRCRRGNAPTPSPGWRSTPRRGD